MIRVGRRAGRRTSRLLAVVLAAAVLAGCGDDGYEPTVRSARCPRARRPRSGRRPRARPSPASRPNPGPARRAATPTSSPPGSPCPTGLVVLPDGSAIVGERDTGRLLQVFPDRSPARELMTVPGIDTAGDGGLLGLALSPTYLEDGLLYAYVSTATDNRVVRFPLGGTPNPVFTGIPRGRAAQRRRAASSGRTATSSSAPATSATPRWPRTRRRWPGRCCGSTSSAAGGRRARCTAGGTGTSRRSARSSRRPTRAGPPTATLYATDDAARAGRRRPGHRGRRLRPTIVPLIEVPAEAGGPGGCAAAGGAVFLGALDGQRVHAFALDGTGAVVGDPEEFLAGQYGRLRTVVLDAEGALWITTSNRDGIGTPVEDDDRVLRILPPPRPPTPRC